MFSFSTKIKKKTGDLNFERGLPTCDKRDEN